MSCRVLGRRAEHALLGAIARRAHAAGARALIGEFIPTKKNAPAAGFYRDAGFVPEPAATSAGAAAAATTIAQVSEIVPLGALDPEVIVTPGIFVQRVVAVSGAASARVA